MTLDQRGESEVRINHEQPTPPCVALGLETYFFGCETLKADEATRSIPVLALTALAMKGDEERILAAGCDGYIAKPMRYQELLETVNAHLAPR